MDLTSPISFSPSQVYALSFNVMPALSNYDRPPAMENTLNNISISRTLDCSSENDRVSCHCQLAIKWNILDAESEKAIIEAECTIAGFAAAPVDKETSDSDAKQIVAGNAVSYLWAKARDLFEQLSSLSPVGRVMLPAINPYALLEKGSEE